MLFVGPTAEVGDLLMISAIFCRHFAFDLLNFLPEPAF